MLIGIQPKSIGKTGKTMSDQLKAISNIQEANGWKAGVKPENGLKTTGNQFNSIGFQTISIGKTGKTK
jgi:hypothetical protein